MFPYIVALAVICLCLSIGLQNRSTWVWYAGWLFFYLAAGFMGTYFFSALTTHRIRQGLGLLAFTCSVGLFYGFRQCFGGLRTKVPSKAVFYNPSVHTVISPQNLQNLIPRLNSCRSEWAGQVMA